MHSRRGLENGSIHVTLNEDVSDPRIDVPS